MKLSRPGYVAAAAVLAACTPARPAQAPPASAPDSVAIRLAERRRLAQERLLNDWAGLSRYRAANDSLPPPGPGENRVVYIGDSITESWAAFFPALFPGKPYIARGISGQTTPQILVRFRQDVVQLKPTVVVILAGTNDIAGNTGPSSLEMIQHNLASMAEIARANGVRVVLASVLPAYDYPWKRGLAPAPKIVALNSWIRGYAEETGAVYLDYHSAMADARGGLRAELTEDGVHPNAAGYAVMAPLAEAAIARALLLGRTGYVRDREAEFAVRDLTRAELRQRIDTAAKAMDATLPQLSPEQWQAPYPIPVGGRKLGTADFLVHLATHLAYHLGQMDYHRRMLVPGAGTVDSMSIGELRGE